MKIALCQLDVKLGKLDTNFRNLVKFAKQAKENNVDLAIFPEMCISGLMVGDKFNDESFCKELMSYNYKINEIAQNIGIAIIWGNIFINTKEKDENGYCVRLNTIFVTQPKHPLNYRFKSILSHYEQKYFISNFEVRAEYPFDYVKIYTNENQYGYYSVGLQIGADISSDEVTTELSKCGLDFIINISSQYFTEDFCKIKDEYAKKICSYKIPFYFVNCVGVQNNGKNIICFSGDSRTYNKYGEKVFSNLSHYQEGIVYSVFKPSGEISGNIISYENIDSIKEKYHTIIKAFVGIDEMLNKPNYIFGLSGGIDSAVSIALAYHAVGNERIKAFNLPSIYNSVETENVAKHIAKKLNVEYKEWQIEGIREKIEEDIKEELSLREVFKPYSIFDISEEFKNGLATENLQARIRGAICLQTLASLFNGIVINNSNKIEMALGYSTLYGDSIGAFCPLGDLTKLEIWEMAKYINQQIGDEIIPNSIIPNEDMECEIMPSAELRKKQIDPMWWGVDDILVPLLISDTSPEDILEVYSAVPLLSDFCSYYSINEKYLVKYGGDSFTKFIEHLEWLVTTISKNVFKRIQSPPIVVTTDSCFGSKNESMFDWEQSSAYKKIKYELVTGGE